MLDQPIWVTLSIATGLMLIGVIVPLLTVMQILEGNLLILMGSYGLSVLGMFLGVIGTAQYVAETRKNHSRED